MGVDKTHQKLAFDEHLLEYLKIIFSFFQSPRHEQSKFPPAGSLLQMSENPRTGLGWSQKQGIQSKSPMWMAETRSFEPLPAASHGLHWLEPGVRSWIQKLDPSLSDVSTSTLAARTKVCPKNFHCPRQRNFKRILQPELTLL